MTDTPAIVAEAERVAAVVDHARLNLFTGMLEDNEAIERAEELGLVERYYEGAAAFFGLSKLRLTRLAEMTRGQR
jgi:hypothetical protein